jgi:RNA polymerase sigma factor (sigma-70 family)
MPQNTWTDQEIVDAICGGGEKSKQAVEHLLVDLCQPIIVVLSRRYKYGKDDLRADLFLHLVGPTRDWGPLRSWNGTSSLKTWLNVVVHNLCINALRKAKISIRLQSLTNWNEPVAATSDCDVGLSAVLRTIEQLPNKTHRLVLLLSRVEGRADEEIADLLKTSPGNVTTMRSRAKAELVALLEGGMDNVRSA